MKGDAAESGNLQDPLGHPDNIRLTVADAESYVLMLLTEFSLWMITADAQRIGFLFVH